MQALMRFWASKWFMLSVEMPLMDRITSPTLILALAALPPSVSCKDVSIIFNYTRKPQLDTSPVFLSAGDEGVR